MKPKTHFIELKLQKIKKDKTRKNEMHFEISDREEALSRFAKLTEAEKEKKINGIIKRINNISKKV